MPTLADLESKYFPGTLGAVPHAQDTEVIAHIDGVAYFSALATAINATSGTGDVIYIVGWAFDTALKLLDPAPPTIMELLAQKAVAGVDVKVVLWTGRNQIPDAATEFGDLAYWMGPLPDQWSFKSTVEANMVAAKEMRTFESSPGVKPLENRVLLDWSGLPRGSRHQKYVVVYNKTLQEMRAFVGGIDLHPQRRATPDHPDADHNWHDVGVELRGDGARSVWADFQTRWNEVVSLPSAHFISPSRGKSEFNPGTYTTTLSAAGAVVTPVPTTTNSVRVCRSYAKVKDMTDPLLHSIPWDTTPPAGGLTQILELYQKAINSATRIIYIEDQGLNNPSLFTAHALLFPLIGNAMLRGVKVIFICGGDGADYIYSLSLFQELGVPVATTHFKMFRVNEIYVHSKIVLIDDEFAAVGSANFWDRSMTGMDTELTAAIVDTGPWVRDLRVKLMAEHFRVDVTSAAIKSVLEDVDQALAMFGFGAPTVGFPHPDSRVYEVHRALPSTKI